MIKLTSFLIFFLFFSSSFYLYSNTTPYPCSFKTTQKYPILKFWGFSLYKLDYIKKKDIKVLNLLLMMDISKKNLNKGWAKGFKKNIKKWDEQTKEALLWIQKYTPDTKSGDCLSMETNKDTSTLYLNNKIIQSTTNLKVKELIFISWLGKNPVDKKIKKTLLEKYLSK